MAVIKKLRFESRTVGKETKWRTYATMESGDEEYMGWGKDFVIGQEVNAYHDDRWNTNKMEAKKAVDKH